MRLADHRFPVQRVEHSEWLAATMANAAADYQAGFIATVDSFLSSRPEPELNELRGRLADSSPSRLREYVAGSRGHSLAFLVLMMTGACNANCPICFTDRRRKAGELTAAERDEILQQARKLGARYVYVPGEGEPTIDEGFWQLLETCGAIGLEAIVFTNGIVFGSRSASRRYWGCEPEEAVARLARLPVSLYTKFWSLDPILAAEMLGVRPERYPYEEHAGTPVPAGLARLLREFPREQLGIEVVVERRNADEIVNRIVPFAEEQRLYRIVEMIQHNGRTLGNSSYDPTPPQVERAAPLLSPTSCTMATCKAVVTARGLLSPRIAVLEHQIPGPAVDVRQGDLFELLHRTDYVVERRYEITGCLCETLPASLAPCELPERSPMPNVAPPGLQVVHSASSSRS